MGDLNFFSAIPRPHRYPQCRCWQRSSSALSWSRPGISERVVNSHLQRRLYRTRP